MNNDIRAIFEAFVTPADPVAALANKYRVGMEVYDTLSPAEQQTFKQQLAQQYEVERKGLNVADNETLKPIDDFFGSTLTPPSQPTTTPQVKTTPPEIAPRPEEPVQSTQPTTPTSTTPPSPVNLRPADTTPVQPQSPQPPRAPSPPVALPTVNVPKPGEIKTAPVQSQAQPAPTTATPTKPVPTAFTPQTPYTDTTKGRRLTTRR